MKLDLKELDLQLSVPSDARKAAAAYVIHEGNRNAIVLPDGTRIDLVELDGVHAKAQFADALWIETLLRSSP